MSDQIIVSDNLRSDYIMHIEITLHIMLTSSIIKLQPTVRPPSYSQPSFQLAYYIIL